ncbi:CoA transferase [Piscinibacter gummiphilus]|uniref:CoA transferase n=1 Tax=Piscinibacter gummiphilus TaxID=946333 RepID=A0ABZ0CRD4_9BURK|nr:CoA transferase [Piscinibacter gummiphilus]WOB07547.1 CoA transferase [Piscinibacter gummiphilus]
MSRLALHGLRVLEVGTGPALAYAGKLFADFGAEVIKAEAPEGDAWRQMPPLMGGESALFAWLNTNKRSIVCRPSATDTAWLAQLARSCDVVLDARALTQGVGLLAQPVWAGAPGGHTPISVDITWFGESGPYAQFTGSEAVCRALSGAAQASGPLEGPPHLPHDVQTGIVAGLIAFSAAVGALIGQKDGSRRYTVSLHEAAFGTVEMEAGIVQDKRHPGRLGVNRFCATHPTGIFETADGWIGIFSHTLPQWITLCETLGRPEWARDPRFANGQLRMAHADEIDAWLIEAFRKETAAHWFQVLGAQKFPAVFVPTMQELLQQAVHRERGAFVPVSFGPRDGERTVEGPGVPLRLDTAGPLPGGRAPSLGEHDAHYRGAAPQRSPRRLTPAPRQRLPLEGIRIVDLTMGWAGPLASRTAADLGAEVIKVESTVYPDWWRGTNFTEEFYRDRLYEKNSNFNLLNRNKLGVTLDLTHPDGKSLLLQLVAGADAVIENYSAEVLPKLGLDYAALSAINERLVMVSMPAFGLHNVWSDTRAYGGTLEQASGLPLYTGHPDGPPAMTSYAYGDPTGGFNAGAALLLALWAQQRTGQGRHLNLSQVEAMLPNTAPYLLEQSAHGAVSPRENNRHPMHAPHGVYRCAGDDAWLLVSATGDAAWQSLCRVIGRPDLAADTTLAHAAGRRAAHDRLDDAIATWARTRDAHDAMHTLQHAGVAAGVVEAMADVLRDPHLRQRGFFQPVERAHVGSYLATTPYFRPGPDALPLRRVSPTLGEHTRDVLSRTLGVKPDRLDMLDALGITGTAARPKAAKASPDNTPHPTLDQKETR